MIELRSSERNDTLYAWVQHVDLKNRHEGDHSWLDGAVVTALWEDTPAFVGRGRVPLLHKLERTAQTVSVVKIYELPDDYRNGILPISSGIAVCDRRDQWCRETGRNKALRRALGKIGYLLDDHKGVVKTFKEQGIRG